MSADQLPFEVTMQTDAEEAVLGFGGDLDLTAVASAGTALREAQAARPSVLLDLRALRFIDSSGLRVILEAQQRAAAAGTRLRIVLGGDGVRRVFTLSGVAGLLDVVEATAPDSA